jgi:capsular polysaccharide biosynthesis protein
MLNTCQRYQQPFKKVILSTHLKQAVKKQSNLNLRAAAIHSTAKTSNTKESKVIDV